MRWLVLLACVGCVSYDETIHVRVHDPRAVVVAEPAPPLELTHEPGGAVGARCDTCAWDRWRPIVGPDGAIGLVGSPSVLERAGDQLHMRFDYVAPQPCHRHAGLCERPAYSVALATPLANIAALDDQRVVSNDHGERFAAKLAVGTGIAATLVGAVLAGWGIAHPATRPATFIAGGAFVGVGTLFTAVGVATLLARDSDVPIQPP